MENIIRELKKLEEASARELKKNPLRINTLRRMLSYLRGTEKPKRETLDKLSLLLGFQNWDSFKEALHGENDGMENYEEKTPPTP